MSNDAEITMLLYSKLLPEEKTVLKQMEASIIKMMQANFITSRPVWTSNTIGNNRVVQLVVPGQTEPKVLVQINEDEFSSITEDEILSMLNQNII